MPHEPRHLPPDAESIISDWDIPPIQARTPHLLTPAVRAKLVEATLDGLSHAQAARYAGIAPATFAKWIKRGERASGRSERDAPYRDLVRILEVAEAQLERALVVAIKTAAFGGDWRAAEALLKRRFPDRWGDRQRIDHHVIAEEAEKLAEAYPELEKAEIVALAQELMSGTRS